MRGRAAWSARQSHNLKVVGSNPIPATKFLSLIAFWIIVWTSVRLRSPPHFGFCEAGIAWEGLRTFPKFIRGCLGFDSFGSREAGDEIIKNKWHKNQCCIRQRWPGNRTGNCQSYLHHRRAFSEGHSKSCEFLSCSLRNEKSSVRVALGLKSQSFFKIKWQLYPFKRNVAKAKNNFYIYH